jgi:hypothetical protein
MNPGDILPDDFDFEALMCSKSWMELSPEERLKLQGVVSGEEEYQLMRETYLFIRENPDQAENLSLEPELREMLTGEFNLRHPDSPEQEPNATRGIPLRTWLSVAASMALFVAVASVWFLITQQFKPVPPQQTGLASNLTVKEKSVEDETGAGNFNNITEDKDFRQNTGNQPGQALADKIQTDEDKEAAGSGKTDTTIIFGRNNDFLAANHQEEKYQAIKMPFLTEKAERKDVAVYNDTMIREALVTKEDPRFSKKAIVSERPEYYKAVPEKKLHYPPHPVSRDPDLLRFLYACP